jgi:lysozyme
MQLSDNGLRLIKGFEGYHRLLPDGSCTTYYCPANVLTLGYGCTVGIKEGDTWTEAQAEDALRKEIAKHEAAVTRLVTVELNQNQADALISFSYNCGSGALATSTLLKRVNAQDWAAAGREFGRWNKGGGKVLPGLVARRAREAALFAKPAETDPVPTMPQAVDPPPAAPETKTVANAGAMIAGTAATALSGLQVSDSFQYGSQLLGLVKEHGATAAIVALFFVTAWFAAIKHSEGAK